MKPDRQVSLARNWMLNGITVKAKHLIKTDDKVKNVLLLLKDHFTKQKNPWELSYEYYHNESGVNFSILFNIILELKGYKIYYSKKHKDVIIKRNK